MKKTSSVIIQTNFFVILSIIYQNAIANSWPIFLPPDYQTLLKLNYIETSQCPNGQGKMITRPLINIQEYLCRNFCPEEWQWIGNSDNKCHEISEFALNNIEITHYTDGSETNYSVITADYGQKESNEKLATFTMTTQPGDHWYCITMNYQGLSLLSCANDIRY